MDAREWSQEVFCPKCRKNILKPNYELHELRCKGPSKLYESRVMQASSLKQQGRQAGRPDAPSGVAIPILPQPLGMPAYVRPPPQSIIREQQKVTCGQCGFRLTFAELDTHDEKCEGKLKRCEYCDLQFPPMVLNDHHTLCQGRKQLMRLSELNERESSGRRSNSSSYHSFDSDRQQPPIQQRRSIEEVHRPPIMNHTHMLLHLLSAQSGDLDRVFTNLFRTLRLQPGEPGLNREQLNQIPTTKYRKKPEQQLCTICYCNMEEDEIVCYLRCTHTYHADCVKKWLQKSGKCPVCKQNAV